MRKIPFNIIHHHSYEEIKPHSPTQHESLSDPAFPSSPKMAAILFDLAWFWMLCKWNSTLWRLSFHFLHSTWKLKFFYVVKCSSKCTCVIVFHRINIFIVFRHINMYCRLFIQLFRWQTFRQFSLLVSTNSITMTILVQVFTHTHTLYTHAQNCWHWYKFIKLR